MQIFMSRKTFSDFCVQIRINEEKKKINWNKYMAKLSRFPEGKINEESLVSFLFPNSLLHNELESSFLELQLE